MQRREVSQFAGMFIEFVAAVFDRAFAQQPTDRPTGPFDFGAQLDGRNVD